MTIEHFQDPDSLTSRCSTYKELPKAPFDRWVAQRKLDLLHAIDDGRLTDEDAVSRYLLSKEELSGWRLLYRQYGFDGLKVRIIRTARDENVVDSIPTNLGARRAVERMNARRLAKTDGRQGEPSQPRKMPPRR
jgi:hypothetical protein